MRRSTLMLVIVALFAVAALPAVSAFAQRQSGSFAVAAAQAMTCTDAKFLEQIGKDLKDIGEAFPKMDMTKLDEISVAVLALAAMRQGYEDAEVALDCFPLQAQMVVTIANISDVLALTLAINTNKDSKEFVEKATEALKGQGDRVKKHLEGVTELIKGK